MPYNLADMKRVEKDPLRAGVIDVFQRESFALDYLTFENVDTLGITVLRTKTLPTVAWRRIGEAWGESKGILEPMSERVFALGGKIDMDTVLAAVKTTVDQRALQMDMFTTAMAYGFNDAFVNGNPTVDPDAITGLWYRSLNIAFLPTSQHVNREVDISLDASALSANEDAFLEYVDELIDACDGHSADCLWMNAQIHRRFNAIIRKKGLFDTTQDNYGREITTYGPGGPKLLDLGVKADQATQIIGNVETVAGTALTGGPATSIYATKLGEKYLQGIQLYPLKTKDKGEIDDGVTLRSIVDWVVGITHWHPRSVARLSGITVV